MERNITLAERVKKTEQKLIKTAPAVNSEEQQDIEKRKNNLILYGIPEPESTELEDKLEEEYMHISEVYKDTVNLSREAIKDMFRLGRKKRETENQEAENQENSNVSKPRPLLIKFHDEDSKTQVLKVSGDLSLKINNEKITIFAGNDMTQNQRTELKKLRDELKKRKDRGEKNIGIRGNKIVNLQFFRDKQANRSRVIWATHIKKKQQLTGPESS